MQEFVDRGAGIRAEAKRLVIDYMTATPACHPGGEGIRQAAIFRECGMDWGDFDKATSSNQQYWLVAALGQLHSEGLIEQVEPSGPWRLAVA